MTKEIDIAFVAALLDGLLQGDARWPAASATNTPREFMARLAADATLAAAFDDLRAKLPANFATLDHAARDSALQLFERTEPAIFSRIVTEAFSAYYMDAMVMDALRRHVGYSGKPPQPEGRDIPPFDVAILPARRIAAKES